MAVRIFCLTRNIFLITCSQSYLREGNLITNRAQDIEELERALNDGEGDDVLNSQAIEIFNRLNGEVRKALNRQLTDEERKNLGDELLDFGRTIKEIRDRRHAHVLDRFSKHLNDLKRTKP